MSETQMDRTMPLAAWTLAEIVSSDTWAEAS